MPKLNMHFLIEPELSERLDLAAAALGSKRSEVARRCIAYGLTQIEADLSAKRPSPVMGEPTNKPPRKKR